MFIQVLFLYILSMNSHTDREGEIVERDQLKESDKQTSTLDPSQQTTEATDQGRKSSGIGKEIWDWTKAIGIAVILAVIIRTFFFSPTIVDGESMMSTLKDGEFLIVNKIVFRIGEPKRGDIIIFHATEKKDYIKRVIGVAGDRIEMRDDQLYVNGELVPEPYLDENKEYWYKTEGTAFTQDFVVDRVPDNSVYVLGDNRRNSTDSRILKAISLDRVIGRADLSVWPLNTIRLLK